MKTYRTIYYKGFYIETFQLVGLVLRRNAEKKSYFFLLEKGKSGISSNNFLIKSPRIVEYCTYKSENMNALNGIRIQFFRSSVGGSNAHIILVKYSG